MFGAGPSPPRSPGCLEVGVPEPALPLQLLSSAADAPPLLPPAFDDREASKPANSPKRSSLPPLRLLPLAEDKWSVGKGILLSDGGWGLLPSLRFGGTVKLNCALGGRDGEFDPLLLPPPPPLPSPPPPPLLLLLLPPDDENRLRAAADTRLPRFSASGGCSCIGVSAACFSCIRMSLKLGLILSASQHDWQTSERTSGMSEGMPGVRLAWAIAAVTLRISAASVTE